MRVLLPPSETKRAGGEGSLDGDSLYAATTLADARARVSHALVALSEGDPEIAAKSLKLGSKNRSELEHNFRLGTSGTLMAVDRYTGVLYDALNAAELEAPAREWLESHVWVQSALFGLISAADRIPAYRLSAGSRLPELGVPLKRVWSAAHAGVEWPESDVVIDLRSLDYAALAPLPDGVGCAVHVAQRGPDGAVRALNHFNKAAKGDLVRLLAGSLANIASVADFLDWASDERLDCSWSSDDRTLTLITELGAPQLAS